MTRKASTGWTEIVTLGREVLRFSLAEPVDVRIAAAAAVQHGVVSTGQLGACGLSASAARSRVAAGRLHRVRSGVYALSPLLPPFGPVAAVVLGSGSRASACHLTGAVVQDLRRDGRVLIDVAVPSSSPGRRGNLSLHSSRRFRACDVEIVNGIPVTSVPRTLLDCAPLLGRRGTEQMIQRAEWNRRFDLRAVLDLLAHLPGHRGAAVLRGALGDAAGARGEVASDVEDVMLVELRAAGAREPECNASIGLGGGRYAKPDFLWRTERLAVELDPRSTHDRTTNYRSDRQRDRALRRVAGIETMRFCDEDLADPAACAAEVVAELATRHAKRPQGGRES